MERPPNISIESNSRAKHYANTELFVLVLKNKINS